MKIIATSDLHGYLPPVPECDLLILAGDLCDVFGSHRLDVQIDFIKGKFTYWLNHLPAKEIVIVCGNHDFVGRDAQHVMKDLERKVPNSHYLHNDGVELFGQKIWGSPMTPKFGNWANMYPDSMLPTYWSAIPEDVDILVIHGPAYGIGDKSIRYVHEGEDPHVGSKSLRNRLDHGNFPNLKLFIWGHIHESYGRYEHNDWQGACVSHCDADYMPNNPLVDFEL